MLCEVSDFADATSRLLTAAEIISYGKLNFGRLEKPIYSFQLKKSLSLFIIQIG
ncbi:MAG: hypothetical protein ACI9V1_003416 [Spirosomataceae bacterium]|jgi:hypothetical protein